MNKITIGILFLCNLVRLLADHNNYIICKGYKENNIFKYPVDVKLREIIDLIPVKFSVIMTDDFKDQESYVTFLKKSLYELHNKHLLIPLFKELDLNIVLTDTPDIEISNELNNKSIVVHKGRVHEKESFLYIVHNRLQRMFNEHNVTCSRTYS